MIDELLVDPEERASEDVRRGGSLRRNNLEVLRGIGEAWFKVTGQNETVMLQVGDALSRPSFDVLVVALEEESATVDVDGELYRISLGQTLADAVAVQ